MKCKFNKAKECIHGGLFDRWKEDKKETAWLTLGVCPYCPVYAEEINKASDVNNGG